MASSTREKEKSKKRRADARRRDQQYGGDYTPTSFTVPQGMSLFKFKEAKKFRLDVVPYEVGKGQFKGQCRFPKAIPNTGGPNPFADTGYEYYERTYFTHTNIGPNERAHYCCPMANFGKPCPVCEHQDQTYRNHGKEQAKPFLPKARQLMLVIDRDAKDKGVQLFESNIPLGLGELLHDFRSECEADDPRLDHWTLEDGMTMEVSVKEESFNGRPNFKPKRIDFVSRKNPLVVEGVMPKLDDLLIEKSYEELSELLHATGAGKKEEDDSEDSEDDSQDSDADSGSDGSQDSDDGSQDAPVAAVKKKGKSDEKEEPTVFDDEEDDEDEDSSDAGSEDASSDAGSEDEGPEDDAGSENDSDAGEDSQDSADEEGSQDSDDGSQDSDDGSVDEPAPKKPAAKPAKKPAKAPPKPAPKKKK